MLCNDAEGGVLAPSCKDNVNTSPKCSMKILPDKSALSSLNLFVKCRNQGLASCHDQIFDTCNSACAEEITETSQGIFVACCTMCINARLISMLCLCALSNNMIAAK